MKEGLNRKKFSKEELEELSKKIDRKIEDRKKAEIPKRGIEDEISDMFKAYENEGALMELGRKKISKDNDHKNLDEIEKNPEKRTNQTD